MKRNSLILILFIIGSFFLVTPIFATGIPVLITINIQPSSTGSVDSPLSQQPVLLVQDANNNPLPGITVVATLASGNGDLYGSEDTDENGLATFTGLSYDKTDAFKIKFSYDKKPSINVVSGSIQLSPGAVSSTNSSISVSPSSVIADSVSVATIKIQCEDQYGNLIPGANVGVSASGSSNTLTQPSSADSPGVVTVNLSSTMAESKVISATVNSVSIGNSSPINFVPGKIAKLLISADSPINTSQKSKITITAQDQSGNTVTGDNSTQVVLSVDNGGSLDSALVTLSSGVASASLSKNTPGTVNFTASVSGINAVTQIAFTSADSTAPIILDQYPLSGAKDVPADVIPYLDFSKAMDDTTLTTDNVELRNSADNSIVPAEVLVANGGKRVIIQPSSNLDLNTEYYLYINTNVSDSSGNDLSSIYATDPFITTSNSQASSSIQEQSILKDIQNINAGTVDTTNIGASTVGGNNQENGQNPSDNVNKPANSTQNNSLGNTGDNSATSSASIDVTSGSSNGNDTTPQNSKENIAAYAQAGLLGVLKNFNMNKFGDWFVANFIWIIILIVILILGYIFWVIYIK